MSNCGWEAWPFTDQDNLSGTDSDASLADATGHQDAGHSREYDSLFYTDSASLMTISQAV